MSEQTTKTAKLPDAITTASAWLGADMACDPDAWLYTLTAEDVRDLEAAATHFQGLGIDIGEISKQTFPLTTFADHLDGLKRILLSGVGLEVLRGLWPRGAGGFAPRPPGYLGKEKAGPGL